MGAGTSVASQTGSIVPSRLSSTTNGPLQVNQSISAREFLDRHGENTSIIDEEEEESVDLRTPVSQSLDNETQSHVSAESVQVTYRHAINTSESVHDSEVVSRQAVSVPYTSIHELPNREINIPVTSISGKILKDISEEEKDILSSVFEILNKEFGVLFNIDAIIKSAKQLTTQGMELVTHSQSQPSGIYIIIDGIYSTMDPGGCVVLSYMTPYDVFGEVSTLMKVSNDFQVRCESNMGSLIKIPYQTIHSSISGKILETKMRSWCIKRACIHTSYLFDELGMVLSVMATAMKSACPFSEWSIESLESMCRLCHLTLFNNGDTIMQMGEAASLAFIIIRGRVEIVTEGSRSTEIMDIKYVDQSCCIGYEEFFKKLNRKYTVRSLSPVLCIPLSREIILPTIMEFANEREIFKKLIITA